MKYIEVEQEISNILHAVCDVALKAGGMQIVGLINQLLSSIKDDAVSSDQPNS